MPYRKKLWIFPILLLLCCANSLVSVFEFTEFNREELTSILVFQLYQVMDASALTFERALIGTFPCTLVAIILSLLMMNNGRIDRTCLMTRYRSRSLFLCERLAVGISISVVFVFSYLLLSLLCFSPLLFEAMNLDDWNSVLTGGILWSMYAINCMVICMNVNLLLGEIASVVTWFVLLVSEALISSKGGAFGDMIGVSKCILNQFIYEKSPHILMVCLGVMMIVGILILFFQTARKDFGVDEYRKPELYRIKKS